MIEFGPDTRQSLIVRLSDRRNANAWEQFSTIYQPLVYRLARSKGLQDADAHEVVQEVMLAVSKAIDSWSPEKGRFRNWLFTIARNLTINYLTRDKHRPIGSGDSAIAALLQNEAARENGDSSLFDLEYRRAVFHWSAEQVRRQSSQKTWSAFWRSTIEAAPIPQVADELGMSVGAVYIARSRTLAKLRTVAADFSAEDDASADVAVADSLAKEDAASRRASSSKTGGGHVET